MHEPPDPRYQARPQGNDAEDKLVELDREMRRLRQQMDALRRPPQEQEQPQPPPQPRPQAQPPRPASQPQPAMPTPPARPQPSPRAPQPSDWVAATTADLRRLRDNLTRLARELNAAVEDLSTGIEAMAGPAPGPQHAPVAQEQPEPDLEPDPRAPAQPFPPSPSADPGLPLNTVEMDAGPFDDLVALSRFEQSLAGLPGVEDVYVKSYGRGRATIELTVDDRRTVVDEMHVHLPYSLDAAPAPDGRVFVQLHPATAQHPGA